MLQPFTIWVQRELAEDCSRKEELFSGSYVPVFGWRWFSVFKPHCLDLGGVGRKALGKSWEEMSDQREVSGGERWAFSPASRGETPSGTDSGKRRIAINTASISRTVSISQGFVSVKLVEQCKIATWTVLTQCSFPNSTALKLFHST